MYFQKIRFTVPYHTCIIVRVLIPNPYLKPLEFTNSELDGWMKILRWSKLAPVLSKLSTGSYFRVNNIRVLFFSTKTQISDSHDTLNKRISLIRDPKVTILPVLEKWIEDGNTVRKLDLQWLIKRMIHYNRFDHALEVSTSILYFLSLLLILKFYQHSLIKFC